MACIWTELEEEPKRPDGTV